MWGGGAGQELLASHGLTYWQVNSEVRAEVGASPLQRYSDSAPNCPLKHTHDRHRHTHTHTAGTRSGVPETSGTSAGSLQSGSRGGGTFPTFHLLLLVGGVALRGSLQTHRRN